MTITLGILLGLSTLLFIGPVFFYLLKSTLEDGFKAGIAVAVGIIVGDIICVLLALYGFSAFFEAPENQKWIALVGGVLLLLFGVKYVIKPSLEDPKKKLIKSKSNFVYFINGFLINFINPFVFGVWFGFYALNVSKLADDFSVVISLIITLIVIFSTDVLKAFFAQKLKAILKPKFLKVVFRIFGVIMLGFGIRLLVVFFSL